MKRSILVIDDEDDAVEMITLMLEDADCRVIGASSGADGIKQLAGGGVDLAIIDILMPVMDGIEFIRSVQDTYPALPIVAISGGGSGRDVAVDSDFLKYARSFGAKATLSKPFRREELLAIVNRLLPPDRAEVKY
jgi:CheY-like chemotaxis protein